MSSLLEQGDIVEYDSGPGKEHKLAKQHLAVIVSVGYFSNALSSLTVLCPITTTTQRHPLHIEIPKGNSAHGFICVERLRALDLNQRNCVKLEGKLDEETMSTVLEALGGIFGI
jgi:mRNA interferase MazF